MYRSLKNKGWIEGKLNMGSVTQWTIKSVHEHLLNNEFNTGNILYPYLYVIKQILFYKTNNAF